MASADRGLKFILLEIAALTKVSGSNNFATVRISLRVESSGVGEGGGGGGGVKQSVSAFQPLLSTYDTLSLSSERAVHTRLSNREDIGDYVTTRNQYVGHKI